MKKFTYIIILMIACWATGCADNELAVNPNTSNYPFRLIVDADEGGDLPDAEDYDLEVKFADYIGGLPNESIMLEYEIKDLEDDMVDAVSIDKIVYEVELDGCVYEREIDFTTATDGLSGTISIEPDTDLGSVPEVFEIVFTLPGADDTEGGFVFEIVSLESESNVLLGAPASFEYEVLDNDVAGEWELEILSEDEFERFKEIFASLNAELNNLTFEDITGKVTAEFEYGEMKFVIELVEEEEVTSCENGETETEIVNKEIEIEAEYEAEDGDLAFEGSHFLLGDDGEIVDELDFIIESEYQEDELNETMTFTFFKVIDEDNYDEGEELFLSVDGILFTFEKD